MDPKQAASRVLLLESVAVFDGDLGLSRGQRNISFCLRRKDRARRPYPTPPIPAIATRLSSCKHLSISAIISSRPIKHLSLSNMRVEMGSLIPLVVM